MQSDRIGAHQDKSEVTTASPVKENLPKPPLNPDGTPVIPMLADAKHHWWKPDGQAGRKTREELRALSSQCRQ